MPKARELATEGGWRAAEKLEASDTENRPVPLPTQPGEPRSTLGTDPRCSPEVVDARPRIREPQEARGRVEEQAEARRHADETRSRMPQWVGAAEAAWRRRERPERSEKDEQEKHVSTKMIKIRTSEARRCSPRRCSPRIGGHARWLKLATEIRGESEGETLRRAVRQCQVHHEAGVVVEWRSGRKVTSAGPRCRRTLSDSLTERKLPL
ncbi:hypothetical protein PR003_g20466 [Phytophthora rubi]|uniref:Uncharacterized protein n=1 Tax=Phytophthora rubi TaxID=129364 RepID=A0A6A4DJK7_9STRA|nr:hypothetical protein PR003_g20466 [Phytophthora rubi]